MILAMMDAMERNTEFAAEVSNYAVQFKRFIIFIWVTLENQLLHNGGPTFKFLFIGALCIEHSSSLRKQ
jgi:hypothetical protein